MYHKRKKKKRKKKEVVYVWIVDMDEEQAAPPDLMAEIRNEEIREANQLAERKEEMKKEEGKRDESKYERKEEKKEEEKEEVKKEEVKKEEKKEEKKDDSKYELSKYENKGSEEEKKSSPKAQKRPKVWLGMPASLNFFNNNRDIRKIRSEFDFLDSLICNKTTEAFDANVSRNRSGSPKIYDDNRVQLNRPGHEDVNYINASFITLKDFNHKVIVAQLPQFENDSFVEDFWQMIYQEQITLCYLMVPDKALKNTPTALFKDEFGLYQYIGKMFINNRRTENSGDPKEYTIEVLPEGNSDAVMCQVHHHAAWQHLQQPPKTRPMIKMIHQFLTEKQVQNANVCVVSVFGCGRACSFLGALYAINQLNNGIEPNICEIMKDIKQQRPRATESFVQYAGIYAVVFDYISRKRGSKKDPINKDINRFIDELNDLTPASSPNESKPVF
uniref:Tyrosine-protein phosphatase domain-containing protein n=1 Tax=Caenorhabditis tropicalis TaxID=1561998 RepID=A0A1I7UC50_9PELO